MSVPDWWEATLLVLAAWRVFHLLGHDDLLDRPRRYVTRLGSKWKNDGDFIPAEYRERLMDFLECPYCLGFWVSLAWWGSWQVWEHGTLVAASLFAISAGVVAAHKLIAD